MLIFSDMSFEFWLFCFGCLSFGGWIYLLFFHDWFWFSPVHDDENESGMGVALPLPHVTAIVAARNEALHIGACIASLDAQDYAGDFTIIVVDDSSDDGTYVEALRAASVARRDVRVVRCPPIESGWSGKVWAQHHGVLAADGDTDYYWFTDADIVHGVSLLGSMIAKMAREGIDFYSLMAYLPIGSFWTRILVPGFIYFFQLLYPFRGVSDDSSPVAGGAGGCMVLRRDILDRAGGLFSIRGALIDDCALAGRIKGFGGRLCLLLARCGACRSMRFYDDFRDFWYMVVRNAYRQLDYSFLYLLLSMLGMMIIFVVPMLLIFLGFVLSLWIVIGLGLLIYFCLCLSWYPTLDYYDISIVYSVTLPIVSVLFMLMTLHSFFCYHLGLGSTWKGRRYADGGSDVGF